MELNRRDVLKAGAAAFTTAIFTGRVRGANDRIALGYIGMGKMGRANLEISMKQPNVEPVAVCDVFQRNLDSALKTTGGKATAFKDFRELLAAPSIDAVMIATPDHWHAYMTVEACKAGKDVYVEKPVCVAPNEGLAMVAAARKYERVVQAGTMQRSAKHFNQAVDLIKSGALGKVTFVRTWNYANVDPKGWGNPPDTDPPTTLNWDLWLGPAPEHQFNANRFGVDPEDVYYSTFRYFWDYAGGWMTDWGVHWLDIVQMAFDEAMPTTISAMGGKLVTTDNLETPDTLQVTYQYPGFVATYEHREGNDQSMFDKDGGILFCGEDATMFLDRGGFQVIPETRWDVRDRKVRTQTEAKAMKVKMSDHGNDTHWANFLECMKTRKKPTSDIEVCRRSTTTCLMGNVAFRSGVRVDFDPQQTTAKQAEAAPFMTREYRRPWKLDV
ncbi:MAG TPA: Gfo/Idh/MocA family oxidoreductase [Bryobacteraceae bacterium]|nr:Gfo/Idh/MocA family oxidoreductase [Bryobacteraceae bacterium]